MTVYHYLKQYFPALQQIDRLIERSDDLLTMGRSMILELQPPNEQTTLNKSSPSDVIK